MKELTKLARRMVRSVDPAEVARLKSGIIGGFYANNRAARSPQPSSTAATGASS